MVDTARHHVTLGYTADGIHLQCSCGWDFLLGFTPTPEYALSFAEQHRLSMLVLELDDLEGVS